MIDASAIRIRYDAVSPTLDEKGLRFFAASEALAAGRGGIVAVSAVTGIARSTIRTWAEGADGEGESATSR